MIRGFTLVETIISVGIFLIVSVVLVDIYLLVSRAQGSLRGSAGIMNETGRVMDDILLSLRTGRIAYERYPEGAALPTDVLHVVDQSSRAISWRVAAVGVDGCVNAPCLQRWTEQIGWVNVLRSGLRVRRAVFNATPKADAQQPRVTILLELEPITRSANQNADTTPLQVTVSPRYYER